VTTTRFNITSPKGEISTDAVTHSVYPALSVSKTPLLGKAQAAAAIKALGDPTRLHISQFLRACTCCPVTVRDSGEVRPVDGLTVGEVCCHITGVERVTSTLSEHLKELREAGLIVTEKCGRHVVCWVPRTVPAALASFFSEVPDQADAPEATVEAAGTAVVGDGCGCG
jgi:ArsR family transcriptional regulator, arsenate/arsenite/antimonite-responsive transcriptional repressor